MTSSISLEGNEKVQQFAAKYDVMYQDMNVGSTENLLLHLFFLNQPPR